MKDRFEKLEIGSEEGRPSSQAQSLPDRFKHLEIGEVILPEKTLSSEKEGRSLCPQCGEVNERERNVCWSCFSLLTKGTAPSAVRAERLTLVLEGKEYNSDDPNLPEDISVLMNRIRGEGYSQRLVSEWRQWRATRNSPRPIGKNVSVHAMSRVTVIKVDGKTYTSSDTDLPADIRALMERVQKEGMTEELARELQGKGGDVKIHQTQTQKTARAGGDDPEFWREISRRLERESKTDWGNLLTFAGPALVPILLFFAVSIIFWMIRGCSAMTDIRGIEGMGR